MKQPEENMIRPTVTEIEAEITRRKKLKAAFKSFRAAVSTLIIVAAVAVLLATLLLPIIRVHQDSMEPTLMEDELMVFVTAGTVNRGDIVAFHYNDQVWVKRVIAVGGDSIDVDSRGVVSVNGEKLTEPYVEEFSIGECTIGLPLNVPEDSVFVMGDNRAISMDSRIKEVGTIKLEKIVGKAVIRIWPLAKLGRPG